MFSEFTQDTMLKNASDAEQLLKLLANKHRLIVLCSLLSDQKSVTELEEITGLSQSALSQHLAKLREANIVDIAKNGKMVIYKISSIEVVSLLSILHLIYCK